MRTAITDLEFLNLSRLVYDDSLVACDQVAINCDKSGNTSVWHVISVLNEEQFTEKLGNLGFFGVAFQRVHDDNRSGEVVVATRGTSSLIDWYDNVYETHFMSFQVMSGKRLMEDTIRVLGERYAHTPICFTGHSLGGKLAQSLYYLAYSEQINSGGKVIPQENIMKAVVFNSATIIGISNHPFNNGAKEFSSYNVKHYYLDGEMLNTALDTLPIGIHLGNTIKLSFSKGQKYIVGSRKGEDVHGDSAALRHVLSYENFDYYMDADGNFMELGGGLRLEGRNDSDTIRGMNLADTINGHAGDDLLYGMDGNDSITGGQGADLIDGGSGDDVLSGNEGHDLIIGGAGNDVLEGGVGMDQLQGGEGNDRYIYKKGDGIDYISEGGPASYADGSYLNMRDTLQIVGYTIQEAKFKFIKSDNFDSLAYFDVMIYFETSPGVITDKITIKNWSTYNQIRVDNRMVERLIFVAADGGMTNEYNLEAIVSYSVMKLGDKPIVVSGTDLARFRIV
ncbi:hypothetical protein K0T92_06700 [Paenibacillus oenotherae]|uniref:Uncharacterized protein n=1 Tax=Paenibacillus oenotherae TaxID=1435645 RepID=A0ABS7D3J1_9BACL|nr:hypothetical protein [Paenibacillus oenotherae]MBW7474429.1 hypothetical protein [Paenibacillus oenotherae]